MIERDDIGTAERLSRRRARLLPVLAILFLGGQGVYLRSADAARPVDHFRISAWLAWALVLLVLLAFGGGWSRGRRVRALMEDETTVANRLRAYAVGFWSAVGACILLYLANMFEPMSAREAIHLVLSAAIAGALVTFGMLERRALGNG